MSPYGNFNLARQELKNVALKASYKLRKDQTKDIYTLPYSFMRVKYGGLIAMDN